MAHETAVSRQVSVGTMLQWVQEYYAAETYAYLYRIAHVVDLDADADRFRADYGEDKDWRLDWLEDLQARGVLVPVPSVTIQSYVYEHGDLDSMEVDISYPKDE
jgi:hypothetical protein